VPLGLAVVELQGVVTVALHGVVVVVVPELWVVVPGVCPPGSGVVGAATGAFMVPGTVFACPAPVCGVVVVVLCWPIVPAVPLIVPVVAGVPAPAAAPPDVVGVVAVPPAVWAIATDEIKPRTTVRRNVRIFKTP